MNICDNSVCCWVSDGRGHSSLFLFLSLGKSSILFNIYICRCLEVGFVFLWVLYEPILIMMSIWRCPGSAGAALQLCSVSLEAQLGKSGCRCSSSPGVRTSWSLQKAKKVAESWRVLVGRSGHTWNRCMENKARAHTGMLLL